MKRTGKFYRENEADVMEMLGLKPTPGSGAGWIVKEDGMNDKIICQLKSTDHESIKVNRLDMDKLEKNAIVEHKIPVFAIQFLDRDVYLLVRPRDLQDVCKYLKTGEVNKHDEFLEIAISDKCPETKKYIEPVKTIKSSEDARLAFKRQNEQKYKRKERSAK